MTAPGREQGTPQARDDRWILRYAEVTRRVRTAGSLPAAERHHLLALLEVGWADSSGIRVSRSISLLQQLARSREPGATVLADLSGAYLLRAERMRTPHDLMRAAEAAGQALEADSMNLVALYNLALALDANGLDARATEAWTAYLRHDHTSGWAAQARARTRALVTHPATTGALPRDPAGIARFAARWPQDAQLVGWDHVLAEWGTALVNGDTGRARERLEFAAALGAGLIGAGRDASLADEVTLIRTSASNATTLRRLARAHQDYGFARREYIASSRERARSHLVRVRATAPAKSPLHHWATVLYGATEAYRDPKAGEPILRQATVEADSVRYPALAGRAYWLLGTSLLRQRRYDDARASYYAAARLLSRAGEREHAGAVQVYAGTAEHHLGNGAAAYASIHSALMSLRPYRASRWLHSALWAQADAAAGDGYPRATRYILDEDVTVTAAAGDPVDAAEARTTRARLLVAGGSAAQAVADLRAALTASTRPSVPAQAREWFQADLWEAEAATTRARDPGRSAVLLDSAVAYWDSQHNLLRFFPPLVSRAGARLAAGDALDAQRDLERILEILASERRSLVTLVERAAVLDSVHALANRIALLQLSPGDPSASLLALDQARAALLPSAFARPAGAAALRPRTAAGETALLYALAGDTLLIWAVRDTVVRLSRTTVSREALLRDIERTHARLERGEPDDAALLQGLQALFERLVRPVEDWVGGPESPLVLIPDPALEGVPFAALRNRRTGRFLVEDHPLRVFPTLPGPAARPTRPGVPRAVLVAATQFDRRTYPDLALLPGALAEIETLGHGYPGAKRLEGRAASREALLAAFPRADLVHFAGHALFDEVHPERSRLLLAPPGAPGGPAELTAEEIEGLRLARGSLVVLSACETIRSPRHRPGGFASLATAFLNAGARGVVGSLWKVEDGAALPLMDAFHRAYRQGKDGPAALRAAQVQMLHAREPRLRSPALWAAFRYSGH